MTDYVDTNGFEVKLQDLADEMHVTHEQLIGTLIGNQIDARRQHGAWFVTPEVADQLKAIYRNAATEPVQEAKPTPWNLREEFNAPAYTEGTSRTKPGYIAQHVGGLHIGHYTDNV